MPVFVVDTNFFIEGHLRNYPPDVFQGYWQQIVALAQTGSIIGIDKTKDEIYRNKDAVTDWCEQFLPADFFKDSSRILTEYAQVIQWSQSQSAHYKAPAIQEFAEASRADAWLVAFGHSNPGAYQLVTYEISEPQRRSKIKIPDVCQHFGVTCINPVEMLRRLGVKL